MYILACGWSRSTAVDVVHTDSLTGCNSNYLSASGDEDNLRLEFMHWNSQVGIAESRNTSGHTGNDSRKGVSLNCGTVHPYQWAPEFGTNVLPPSSGSK